MVDRRRVAGVTIAVVGGAMLIVWALTGGIGYPTIALDDAGEWSQAPDDDLQVRSNVTIENPNPTGVIVDGRTTVITDLTVNNVSVATANHTELGIGTGESRHRLDTPIDPEGIEHWWPRFIEDGETITGEHTVELVFDGIRNETVRMDQYRVDSLANDTPLLDTFDHAVRQLAGEYGASDSRNGAEFVHVELINPGVTWQSAYRDETTLRLRYVIRNHGELSVPATPQRVTGEVRANDIPIFEIDSEPTLLAGSTLLMPGSGDNVAIGIEMRQKNLTKWFTEHVVRGEQTTFEVTFRLEFEHPVTGLTFTIPDEDLVEATCTIQTSIFIDQQDGTVTC